MVWMEGICRKVEVKRKQYPDAFIFSSDDYKTAAVLNFFLKEMVYSKNIVGERALQFDFVGTNLKTLMVRTLFSLTLIQGLHNLVMKTLSRLPT